VPDAKHSKGKQGSTVGKRKKRTYSIKERGRGVDSDYAKDERLAQGNVNVVRVASDPSKQDQTGSIKRKGVHAES